MRSFIKKFIKKIIIGMNPKITRKIFDFAVFVLDTIRNSSCTFVYKIHKRMDPSNFLPEGTVEKKGNQVLLEDLLVETTKKRIRIVYPSGTSWSCIGTLYDALKADDRYQVYVITENYPNYIKVMVDKKCDYITLDDYDITQDKPDVLIMTSYSSTPKKLKLEEIHKFAGKIIALFPNVIINEPDMDDHWRWVKNAYEIVNPDYYLFDSLPYKFSGGYIDEDKAVHIGCPIFDELYEKMQNASECHKSYEKLKGKKTFLWATDHGIRETHAIEALSIDLYIKEFFEYFAEHTELGLIIRLHPYLKRELLKAGSFWTESDFAKIREYCDKSPNIVWDEVQDYSYAFKASDALLVDVNCGFTFSYLVTGKPICRLMRNDMSVSLIHPEFNDAYYFAKNMDECKNFINTVVSQTDTKKEKRKTVFKETIHFFDGQNGQRIKAFIDEKVFS